VWTQVRRGPRDTPRTSPDARSAVGLCSGPHRPGLRAAKEGVPAHGGYRRMLGVVDGEVRRIIDECYAEGTATVRDNQNKLDSIGAELGPTRRSHEAEVSGGGYSEGGVAQHKGDRHRVDAPMS